MKFNRQILASIFLILFGIIQLADLHIVSHDDNDVDCSLCKFTLDNHNTNFTSPDTITVSDVILVPTDVVRITYVNQYFGSGSTHTFLNKAPPVA
ncbi:hypothetical protein [Aquimarina muelleri]|uniref:Uncharacterized protein n=1 Tax=Aquimarina muelleri TaxID=279356 RepID=A0A918JT52_9FLAO|nr:hypothetical protein [Aquimarina muelleri]MCX2761684.1 hypothetical protein [Aquimarina muelleri]GGX07135.1 hypothetical protein GCM10007384_05800 [Aquimarina muelleri]